MAMHSDQDAIDRQREHFNSIADRYHVGRSTENHLHLKKLMWNEALGDISRFRGRPISMLEPMCGFAEGLAFVKEYISDQVTYSGFDYSDAIVAQLKREQPALNVWQQDATRFEGAEDSYEVIFLVGGLHHVPNHAARVVKSVARTLRPGGLFINFEPTFGNGLFRAAREQIYKSNSLFDEQTERSFPVKELLNMFRNAGLSNVKTIYPGLLSYILYYNPDAFPMLNVGRRGLVDATFKLDRLFYASAMGSFFSFATLSIWERPR